MSQVEKASKEGLSCLMGDLNLDLKRFEEMKYYAKKEFDEFQLLAAEIEILNFGYTWRRVIEGVLQQSSLDSALIIKIRSVKNYNTVDMNYNSDHSAICVDLHVNVQKYNHSQVKAGLVCCKKLKYWQTNNMNL